MPCISDAHQLSPGSPTHLSQPRLRWSLSWSQEPPGHTLLSGPRGSDPGLDGEGGPLRLLQAVQRLPVRHSGQVGGGGNSRGNLGDHERRNRYGDSG
jgi:hypothetical protein